MRHRAGSEVARELVVRGWRASRGGELGVVAELSHEVHVPFSADEVVEQRTALATRHDEHAESEVEDVDRTAVREVPTASHARRQ